MALEMTKEEIEAYNAKISKMTDRQLVDEISAQVFEATMKTAFRQDDTIEHTKCGLLHTHCSTRETPGLYQRGWESGTDGLRPT